MLLTSTSAACPLCGAQHAVCGRAADTTPVDVLARKGTTVATQKYRVTVNGHQTTMKLSAEDAKAYPDARPVDESEQPIADEPAIQPPTEPEPVADEPETPDGEDAPAKSRRAPNKARRADADK